MRSYSQTKNGVSDDGDDRDVVKKRRLEFKGLPEIRVSKPDLMKGAVDYHLLDKPGRKAAVSNDNRTPEIISHASILPVTP